MKITELRKKNEAFEMNGYKIKKYIPFQEKLELVDMVLQESDYEGIFEYGLQKMLTELYMVFYYTDIEFSIEDKTVNRSETYDVLKTSGILDEILDTIPKEEYILITQMVRTDTRRKENTRQSLGGIISAVINDLPKQAEAVGKIIDEFDEEKFEMIKKLAIGAGDRNLN